MCSGVLCAEHTRHHIGAIHEQEELVGQDIRFLCARLLRQLAKARTDGLFMLDRHLVTGVIRFGIFRRNIEEGTAITGGALNVILQSLKKWVAPRKGCDPFTVLINQPLIIWALGSTQRLRDAHCLPGIFSRVCPPRRDRVCRHNGGSARIAHAGVLRQACEPQEEDLLGG